MKTFNEVIDNITPEALTAHGMEYRDEMMANEKFLLIISVTGAQTIEKLIVSLNDLVVNRKKPEACKAAAENMSLDLLSCLSTAFSIGMAVGMKMMGERRVQ